MNIVIFSKDRPAQLQLLIRSIEKYFVNYKDFTFNILYKHTSTLSELGYDFLKERYPEFKFHKEENFKDDLLKLINVKDDLTMFGVDDDVFKDYFDMRSDELSFFQYENDCASLSLRMYKGIKYCYSLNIPNSNNDFVSHNKWNWGGKEGDWGYPMSIDFSIFKTCDILPLLQKLNYYNPNTLEAQLSMNPIHKPYMMCFDFSKIVNLPINRVQNTYLNRSGNVSVDYLNEEFQNDKQISMKNICGLQNISAHQEVEIILEDM